MASQTKLKAGSESGYRQGCWGFLREFFPTFADLLELQGRCYRGNGVVQAACLLANAFGVLSRIFLGPRLRVRIRASNTRRRKGKGVRRGGERLSNTISLGARRRRLLGSYV